MNESLSQSLAAWVDTVGVDHVITDQGILDAVGTATFSTSQHVAAIVKPANREEVQACVRVANQFQIAIYPVSTGNNWGYGSSVPPRTGCVILDLARLDAIVDFNETLAYVTIQPGVTQGQLFEFLQQKGGRLWMDATGSSPNCSIIGNTLERGFGHTPYGDHFAHACGMEVVLPTGECIHTGFGRFQNAVAAPVYPWGVGPYIDGLFTQSNLGIVTQMTVWLMPKPSHFQAFNFSIEGDSELEGLLDGLRQLRLEGTIRSTVHIGDSYKVLSSIRQYPWDDMDGQVPLSEEVLAHYRARWRFGAWNGSGGLYGTRRQVRAATARIKQVLSPRTAQLKFLNDRKLRVAPHLATPYQKITGTNLLALLKLIRPAYGLLKGEPTYSFLSSAYWRKKESPPQDMDPDRDGCGLIWCTPVTPNEPHYVRRMLEIVRDVFSNQPFEPAMSLTMINERSLENVISITYDRAISGEDERATAVRDKLLTRLKEAGYYPYRSGIQDMELISSAKDSHSKFLTQIKDALDPNGVIAPGRYDL